MIVEKKQIKKILILGSNGQLGSYLLERLPLLHDCFEVEGIQASSSNPETNFANIDPLEKFINGVDSDIVINCLGMTNVDLCEQSPNKAYLSNAKICKNLWSLQKNKKFKIIHISTDHLYDSNIPSTEEKIVLKNYYAYSKYLGELELSNSLNACILRVNFFGKSSSTKLSFTDWLVRSSKENPKLNLFSDVFFSPVHQSTIADVVVDIVQSDLKGTFNLGSTRISKKDFALHFLKMLDLELDYVVSSINNSKLGALRPFEMSMNSQKLLEAISVGPFDVLSEINKAVWEYKNEK